MEFTRAQLAKQKKGIIFEITFDSTRMEQLYPAIHQIKLVMHPYGLPGKIPGKAVFIQKKTNSSIFRYLRISETTKLCIVAIHLLMIPLK